MKVTLNTVAWLDRGHLPTFLGFCPSKKAWDACMKKMSLDTDPDFCYPRMNGNATCSKVTHRPTGRVMTIITIDAPVLAACPIEVLAGAIAHESWHVWGYVLDHIGELECERRPIGDELGAYNIQRIFQELFTAALKARELMNAAAKKKPLLKKASGKKKKLVKHRG